MKKLLLALLLSSACALPAFALTTERFQAAAAQVFLPVINEFDIPGLAVGITFEGKHYIYTYGEANREAKIKVTGDTLFELGSISKLFNVTLAALAEQQGVFNLEAPVSSIEPRLRGGAFDQITLMDLATHTTAGLPLQVPSHLHNDAALILWLQHWKPNATTPMRSYSNVSIGLLGALTAKAMGKDYAALAEEFLFPMLGLTSTFIHVPNTVEPRYAYGYSRDDDKPLRVSSALLAEEAYGVKSTAHDLLKFLDISLGKTDNPQLRAAVAMTQTGQSKTEFYIQDMIWEQYPWPVDIAQLLNGNSAKMVYESQPVTMIHPPLPPQRDSFLNKTGATNGFGAYLVLIPAHDMGIVVLANRNYPNEERVKATYNLLKQLKVIP